MSPPLSPVATPAILAEPRPAGGVRCGLCAYRCIIQPGKQGVCGVRRNVEGELVTLAYGRTICQGTDPVEKKPLFHFYPGSRAFSIATAGCNFRCAWCQNWEFARLPGNLERIPGRRAEPRDIVFSAIHSGCRSIAYTYTEPTVFFEYASDCARLARETGLANLFVTNGYLTDEALHELRPWLDAANVDLKAFRERTYRRWVKARLQPVLDGLRTLRRLGIWVEVTTLLVPGINDDPSELEDLARFLVSELGADTPWHVSRFFPAHRMIHLAPTPIAALESARRIGLEQGLRYVYVGNSPRAGGEDTRCPQCARTLIRRRGFRVLHNEVRDGRCPECATAIAGVGLG